MSTTIECNETCCEVIAALQTALQEAEAERDAAKEELRQTWEAIRELSIGCYQLQVVAHFGDEVHAVNPDRVEGVLKAVSDRIKGFNGWGSHTHWTRCIDGAERAEEAERKLTDMRGTVADFMDKNDALADKLALAVEGIRDAISLFHTYNYGKPTAPSIINTHLNSVVSQLEADK